MSLLLLYCAKITILFVSLFLLFWNLHRTLVLVIYFHIILKFYLFYHLLFPIFLNLCVCQHPFYTSLKEMWHRSPNLAGPHCGIQHVEQFLLTLLLIIAVKHAFTIWMAHYDCQLLPCLDGKHSTRCTHRESVNSWNDSTAEHGLPSAFNI